MPRKSAREAVAPAPVATPDSGVAAAAALLEEAGAEITRLRRLVCLVVDPDEEQAEWKLKSLRLLLGGEPGRGDVYELAQAANAKLRAAPEGAPAPAGDAAALLEEAGKEIARLQAEADGVVRKFGEHLQEAKDLRAELSNVERRLGKKPEETFDDAIDRALERPVSPEQWEKIRGLTEARAGHLRAFDADGVIETLEKISEAVAPESSEDLEDAVLRKLGDGENASKEKMEESTKSAGEAALKVLRDHLTVGAAVDALTPYDEQQLLEQLEQVIAEAVGW